MTQTDKLPNNNHIDKFTSMKFLAYFPKDIISEIAQKMTTSTLEVLIIAYLEEFEDCIRNRSSDKISPILRNELKTRNKNIETSKTLNDMIIRFREDIESDLRISKYFYHFSFSKSGQETVYVDINKSKFPDSVYSRSLYNPEIIEHHILVDKLIFKYDPKVLPFAKTVNLIINKKEYHLNVVLYE